jgi:hypothetical protein
MSIAIKSGSSSDLADVTPNKEMKVALPASADNAGFALLAAETDAGTITGDRTVVPGEITSDFRLRVGIDTPVFNQAFLGTVIDTANIRQTLTTMTAAQSGGFLRLNTGNSVTSGHSAVVQTYRTFPLYGAFPTYFEEAFMFTSVQANNVIEIGPGFVSGTSAPTDGLFFRIAGGELRCVLNNAGTETQSDPLTPPTANERHKYSISACQDMVHFWIDDILMALIPTPASQDSPTASNYLPMVTRIYNSNTVAVAVQGLIAEMFISLGDGHVSRGWEVQQVGNGGGAYQAQPGQTQGQTSNYTNSAAPPTATLSNTTPSSTALGGHLLIPATVGAETDYCLFAFTVPAASATVSGKNLVITGIRIDAINTGAAVGATATVLQWGVAVGSTAASLATAEGAGTKIARRLALGFQTFPAAAAIGAQATPIQLDFTSPLFIEAGNVFHVLLKMPIGLATASQQIRVTVTPVGYFE